MRLIMMGTGPFAVPTFNALYETSHQVVALVTRPTKKPRGNRPPPINPMREVAVAHGTPVLDPDDINCQSSRDSLIELRPEMFIVCDYGQILSSEVLSIARLGGINLHASLLPKYRGAAPINWAIYHGDIETGVTVIHMTPRIDAGPSVAQLRIPIAAEDNAVSLEIRLAELGAPLVCKTIDEIASGAAKPIQQESTLVTKAPRLKKTDGHIDWSLSATAIANHLRAMIPWPGSYAFWNNGGKSPLRLILKRVSAQQSPSENAPSENVSSEKVAGTVIEAQNGRLLIATGKGLLSIESIQPAGKRELTAEEFIRGYRIQPGARME